MSDYLRGLLKVASDIDKKEASARALRDIKEACVYIGDACGEILTAEDTFDALEDSLRDPQEGLSTLVKEVQQNLSKLSILLRDHRSEHRSYED